MKIPFFGWFTTVGIVTTLLFSIPARAAQPVPATDSRLSLSVTERRIALKADRVFLREILREISEKTGIKTEVLEGVPNREVSVEVRDIPYLGIGSLLEEMGVANYGIALDHRSGEIYVYVMNAGSDLSQVSRGKTLLQTAGFANGAETAKVKGKDVVTVKDGREGFAVSYLKDELLVQFHLGVTQKEVADTLARYGVAATADRSLDRIGYVKITLPPGLDAADVARKLAREPVVKSPEPNYIQRVLATSDPLFQDQWYAASSRFEAAWPTLGSEKTVTVAVIDTGVQADHPELAGRVLNGYDFVAGKRGAVDDNGHGTFVSGIIAANANSVGIRGLSPTARILPVKVVDAYGAGTYEDAAKGIIYAADNGAKVINLSIGGYAPSPLLRAAVGYAQERGCIVIAAGGNDGIEREVYPAALPDVVGVAALEADNEAWPSSNKGHHIVLAAPGANILSSGLKDGYVVASGTSAASSMVSALAATLLAERPQLSSAAVIGLLQQTARDLGSNGRDAVYGLGAIDAAAALQTPVEPFHDAAARGVRVEPLKATQGNPVHVVATVQNSGTYPAQSVEVIVSSIVNGKKKVIGRAAREVVTQSSELSFAWTPEKGDASAAFEVQVVTAGDANPANDFATSQPYTLAPDGDTVVLYPNEPPVHGWIAYQALRMLPDGPLKAELGKYAELGGNNHSLLSGNWLPSPDWNSNHDAPSCAAAESCPTALIEGAWEEDVGNRSLDHFWGAKGGYHDGLFINIATAPQYTPVSALVAGQQRFRMALDLYRTDKNLAYWWLGRAAHLLSDMGAPAHALKDPHARLAVFDLSRGLMSSDSYENWLATTENYKAVDATTPGLAIPDYRQLADYPLFAPGDYAPPLSRLFNNLAELGNDFDSDDYPGEVSAGSYNRWHGYVDVRLQRPDITGMELVTLFNAKIADLALGKDYEIHRGKAVDLTLTEVYRVYFYRETLQRIGATDKIRVTYSDDTQETFFFITEPDDAYVRNWNFQLVPGSILKRSYQKQLQGGAIAHVAALYQLFWEKTHSVNVDPASFSFGNVAAGTSATKTFTVTNSGASNVSIRSISKSGTAPEQFTLANDRCTAASLPAGGTCSFDLTFTPSGSSQPSLRLAIETGDSGAPQLQVEVNGTGRQGDASSWLELDRTITPEFTGGKTYSVYLRAGEGISVVLSPHLNSGSLYVSIHDDPTRSALSNTNGVYNGQTAALNFTAHASGTYHLRVGVNSGFPAGSYDLTAYSAWFNPGVRDRQRSFYSTSSTSRYLSNGSYQVPSHSSRTSWFRFTARKDATLSITLGCALNGGALYMALYQDPGGSSLASVGNIDNGESGTLTFAFREGDVYYLKVSPDSGNPEGSFTLAVSPAPEAERDTDGDYLSDAAEYYHGTDPLRVDSDGDGGNDYNELLQGSDPLAAAEHSAATASGWGQLSPRTISPAEFDRAITVEHPGQAAWYRVELTEGQGITALITARLNSGSLYLSLHRSTSGSALASSDAVSNGDSATLTFTAQAGGSYYLRVAVNAGAPVGNYQLTLFSAWFNAGVVDSQRSFYGTSFTSRLLELDHSETGELPRLEIKTRWHRLTLKAGQGITAVLTPHLNSGTLYMALYDDPFRSSVANTTSTGHGQTSTLSFTAQASGTYYLKVAVNSGWPCGSYRLTVHNAWFNPRVTDSQRSFHGTSYTSRYLAEGSYPVPSASSGTEWFRFTAQKDATVSITMTGTLNSGALYMALYERPGGSSLSTVGGISNGRSGTLTFTFRKSGVYYLKVAPDSGTVDGSFTLSASSTMDADRDSDGDGLFDAAEYYHGTSSFQADTDSDGHGDEYELLQGADPLAATEHGSTEAREWLQSAARLISPAEFEKTITVQHPGQTTWYKFELASGHGITALATAGLNSGSLYLSLYNAAGSSLTSSGSVSDGESSTLSFTAQASGVYYLKVAVNAGAPVGRYQLTLFNAWFNPGFNDTPRSFYGTPNTARPLEQSQTLDLSGLEIKTQWHRIALNAGQAISTTLTPQINSGSLFLSLYRDPLASSVAGSTGVYSGGSATLNFTAQASGTYYLRVAVNSGWPEGSYELTVSGVGQPATEYPLSASGAGSGFGSISAPGLACSGLACSGRFPANTQVVVAAVPAADSTFTGWSGACSGAGSCTITMNRAQSLTATFALRSSTLTVNTSGDGSGLVRWGGRSASAVPVVESYPYHSVVTLTAVADTGSSFNGWSGGGCSGTGDCTVTMDQARSVTAAFVRQNYPLYVAVLGGGGGSVSGDGLSCAEGICTGTYRYGSAVTLTANPEAGHTFTGWSGAGCSGSGACTTTVRGLTRVSASFTPPTPTVTVAVTGDGGGTVTSAPQGISCSKSSGTASLSLPYNSTLELFATPDASSSFAGWNGACSGKGSCTLLMSEDKAVSASFNLAPKAMVGTTGYDSLYLAYAGAASGSTILALDLEFPEQLRCESDKAITLRGGYRTDYSSRSGVPTALRGSLKIQRGRLTVDGILIR